MHWSKGIFALSLNLFCFQDILFTPEVSAETIDSSGTEPPALITDPLIRVTFELLKRGLWGSTSVEVTINSTGKVDSCIVEKSQNPSFDSLVKCRVDSAIFSPTKENGRKTASVVEFEVDVPKDSLLEKCMHLSPNFIGHVVDTSLKMDLPKTRVLLYYTDTTEDVELKNGFSSYMSLIGNTADQRYNRKLLITNTDSLGRFAFRCLPVGQFFLSVQSSGHEIGQFRGRIEKGKQLLCRYILEPAPEPITEEDELTPYNSTYAITVYGKQPFTEKQVVIAKEEIHVGFSPRLSNIVQAKAEIRRVPEGPSMMLVRSGCPFDNVYLIAGVPMLAPFHFGGRPYDDIDGVMVSALSNVKVTLNDIAAKRVDVSGCIVEADPGKIKYDNCRDEKGFYMKGDFSMLGVDLIGVHSSKKNSEDYVQIGCSISDDYQIACHGIDYTSSSGGIGTPLRYGNATLTGSKSIGRYRSTAFGWFAWDQYNTGDSDVLLPWGMGSIKFKSDSSNRSFTIGGSRQFFGTVKQFISKVITNRTYLNNGELSFDLDTIVRKPFTVRLSGRVNRDEWNGFVVQKINDTVDTLCSPQGAETGVHLNPSLIKQTGRVTTELDILTSTVKYTDGFQFICDAGASVNYAGDNYNTGIFLGRVTSRPDIRGLPDSQFRKRLNYAYVASLPFFFRWRVFTKISIEPYIRYCTNAPRLDPVKLAWDPAGSTPVLAGGADFGCHIVPTSWVELTAALNLADTKRLSTKSDSLLSYEWNLPWTIRAGLHLHSNNEKVHLYIDFIRAKGLPYYDIDNLKYETLPVYKSIDLSFQIRPYEQPQRFLNRLDCYATLKNLPALFGKMNTNTRDYYWDENGIRQPIFLGGGRMDIGARFGFSFKKRVTYRFSKLHP